MIKDKRFRVVCPECGRSGVYVGRTSEDVKTKLHWLGRCPAGQPHFKRGLWRDITKIQEITNEEAREIYENEDLH